MFDEYSSFPKERVRVFFKYLANASTRHIKNESRESVLNSFEPIVINEVRRQPIIKEQQKKEVIIIPDERREELEIKIKMFYTQNKYLPFEIRLKKLKARASLLKRNKGSKVRVIKIKEKIKRCETLLKEVKKLEVSSH